MKVFGEPGEFALSYEFAPLPPDLGRRSPYLCSEGWLQIHVKGRNLCELDRDPPPSLPPRARTALYDHLYSYLEWTRTHLDDLLEERPFPLALQASSAADFQRRLERRLKERADDEDTLALESLHDMAYRYFQSHSFAAGTDGGYPPALYIRSVGGQVELSWDNKGVTPYRGPCRYASEEGSELVGREAFRLALGGWVDAAGEELRRRVDGVRP